MSDLKAIVESPDPVASLEERGASLRTSRQARPAPATIRGVEVKSDMVYAAVRRWTLPDRSGVTASFSQEGFKHLLIKLFTSEIQVGDPRFDDAVYITTSTEKVTAEWLKNDAVQEAILSLVSAGGDLAVHDDRLILTVIDEDDPDVLPIPEEEALIVGSLMSW